MTAPDSRDDLARALQRLQAERDAARAERDAARLERDAALATGAARLRFLAAAGHDLRQPLHALGLNSAAVAQLARHLAHAPLARLAGDMAHTLQYIGSLVDNLGDLAQLDAGRLSARPHDGPLLPVLHAALRLYAPLAQARGLQLQLQLPHGRSADTDADTATGDNTDTDAAWQVHTDPLLLHRVLGNLLANSLKYTPSGQVQLRVEPLADGRVRLVVEDSGIGIAEHEQARVFDEFFRGQAARQQAPPAPAGNRAGPDAGQPGMADQRPACGPDRTPGLGLGLAIVRRITTLLGIGLSLHSRPGAGTRVALLLPAAQGSAGTGADADADASKPATSAAAAP